VDFYGIMNNGGFDVIIGNPPYVEYSKVKGDYTIRGYQTESCGNLYAFVTERAIRLLKGLGSFGFIVPISLVCTKRMETLQRTLTDASKLVWLSNFAERPSKLFVGSEVLLTIALARTGKKNECHLFTTGFTKWTNDERSCLFDHIVYQLAEAKAKPHVIPKCGYPLDWTSHNM
jgi:methylase of polypeptide subunit release factors